MKIEIIKCLQDNYSYLLVDEINNNACVIDPSEAEPIISFAEKNKIKIKYILNTHHHYDHVGGNNKLKKKYNSCIVGFKEDKDRIPDIDILVEENSSQLIMIKILFIKLFKTFSILKIFSLRKLSNLSKSKNFIS